MLEETSAVLSLCPSMLSKVWNRFMCTDFFFFFPPGRVVWGIQAECEKHLYTGVMLSIALYQPYSISARCYACGQHPDVLLSIMFAGINSYPVPWGWLCPFTPPVPEGYGPPLACGSDPSPGTALFSLLESAGGGLEGGVHLRAPGGGRGLAGGAERSARLPFPELGARPRGHFVPCRAMPAAPAAEARGSSAKSRRSGAGQPAAAEGGAGRAGLRHGAHSRRGTRGAFSVGSGGGARQQVPVVGKSRWRPRSSTCLSCSGWPTPSTWTRTT